MTLQEATLQGLTLVDVYTPNGDPIPVINNLEYSQEVDTSNFILLSLNSIPIPGPVAPISGYPGQQYNLISDTLNVLGKIYQVTLKPNSYKIAFFIKDAVDDPIYFDSGIGLYGGFMSPKMDIVALKYS